MYVTGFDYFDKAFIVLYSAGGGVSIISFASVIGAHEGIVSGSFTLIFYLTSIFMDILFYLKLKGET